MTLCGSDWWKVFSALWRKNELLQAIGCPSVRISFHLNVVYLTNNHPSEEGATKNDILGVGGKQWEQFGGWSSVPL